MIINQALTELIFSPSTYTVMNQTESHTKNESSSFLHK
jgi:hypothetical protein